MNKANIYSSQFLLYFYVAFLWNHITILKHGSAIDIPLNICPTKIYVQCFKAAGYVCLCGEGKVDFFWLIS